MDRVRGGVQNNDEVIFSLIYLFIYVHWFGMNDTLSHQTPETYV